MKRIVGIGAGLGILGGVLVAGKLVLAQAPPPAVAPRPAAPVSAAPQTKIGMVNFMKVVKEYKKAQAFQDYVTKQAQQIEKELEPKKNEMIKLRNELQKPDLPAAAREQKEKELKKHQRDMEERAEEIRKNMAKQNGDMIVMLYKEVEEAIGYFAKANGIEVVFQYSDADKTAAPNEFYHPKNVDRKIQVGAAMPIYMAPGIDVTYGVVQMLNSKFTAGAGQPGTAPAPR